MCLYVSFTCSLASNGLRRLLCSAASQARANLTSLPSRTARSLGYALSGLKGMTKFSFSGDGVLSTPVLDRSSNTLNFDAEFGLCSPPSPVLLCCVRFLGSIALTTRLRMLE